MITSLNVTPIKNFIFNNSKEQRPKFSSSSKDHPLQKVSFGAFYKISGLQDADYFYIKTLLAKCHYGKMKMLENPNFSVVDNGNTFLLKNFYQNLDNENEVSGMCEELAYKVAKKLEKKLGTRYFVLLTQGSCQYYGFDSHHFITLIEKNEKNREKIEKILEKCSEALKLLKEAFEIASDKNVEQKPELITRIKELGQMALKFSLQKEDLKGAILVDPSFNIVKQYSSSGEISGYKPLAIYKEEENPVVFWDDYSCFKQFSFPLGYVEDVAPELEIQSLSQKKDLVMFDCLFKLFLTVNINGEKSYDSSFELEQDERLMNFACKFQNDFD